MIYKSGVDAANFSCCAANKLITKLTFTTTTGSFTIPAIIPLKAPCAYNITVRWSAFSTGGSSLVKQAGFAIVQLTSGGAILPVTATFYTDLQNAPGTGTNLTFAKNATSDSLDLVLTAIAMVGTASHSIELEVLSSSNF